MQQQGTWKMTAKEQLPSKKCNLQSYVDTGQKMRDIIMNIGDPELEFKKKRLWNHKTNFRNEKYRNNSRLVSHVWWNKTV